MKTSRKKTVIQKMFIIAIEGNIAAGKSTFVEELKKRYEGNITISFLDEPVDEWEKIKDIYGVSMLQKYYSNPAKYSFAFQMMALGSRLNNLKQKVKSLDPSQRHVIITERSVYTDREVFAKMLHDQKMMEDVEFKIYNKWFDDFVDIAVDSVVMLKTSPPTSFARVNRRGRAGEVIPLDYLERCDEYHKHMLDNLTIPTFVFDADRDIYENPEVLEEWLKTMDNIIQ